MKEDVFSKYGHNQRVHAAVESTNTDYCPVLRCVGEPQLQADIQLPPHSANLHINVRENKGFASGGLQPLGRVIMDVDKPVKKKNQSRSQQMGERVSLPVQQSLIQLVCSLHIQ